MKRVEIEDKEFIEAFDYLKEQGFNEETLLKEKRKAETAIRIIMEILATNKNKKVLGK